MASAPGSTRWVGTEAAVGCVVVDHEHGTGGIHPGREATQPAPARRVQSNEQLWTRRDLVWRHDEIGDVQCPQRLRGPCRFTESHPHRGPALPKCHAESQGATQRVGIGLHVGYQCDVPRAADELRSGCQFQIPQIPVAAVSHRLRRGPAVGGTGRAHRRATHPPRCGRPSRRHRVPGPATRRSAAPRPAAGRSGRSGWG